MGQVHNGKKLVSQPRKSVMAEYTIGQLAKLTGINTSAIRYYEQIGLLEAKNRTQSGYRIYSSDSEITLKFILKAKQVGFSLEDIKNLIIIRENRPVDFSQVTRIIKKRTLEIDKELTKSMVLRHEMESFLQEVSSEISFHGDDIFKSVIDRICSQNPSVKPQQTLDWLYESSDCLITQSDYSKILIPLRGIHVHIWMDESVYNILLVSDKPEVYHALEELAKLEQNCLVHTLQPGDLQLSEFQNGFLFQADGENAFLFARLFLELSASVTINTP